MKRIYVSVTDYQYEALKKEAAHNGSTIAEEIRRAVLISTWFQQHEREKASAEQKAAE
jgi:hypothetical protein